MNKPITLSAKDYNISKINISAAALHVVEGLKEAGFEAYLVGGCVRDLILGLVPKDFDVATSAAPEQVGTIFRDCRTIGRRFRIAHVRYNREIIEVATFRGNPMEKQNPSKHEMRQGQEGQLIRDNVFGTQDEDAFRRDFTVNALYYDPVEEVVLDYMDSVADIDAKILRNIGDAKQRFTEDPVRMLRMIRFAAKLGFSMEDGARELIEEHANLLGHVSAPRMFEEVLKLFHGGQAVRSFEMLREFGLFKTMFPFTSQHLVEGELGLPERALANTDARIQAGKPVIPAFLFACLLWDPVREDANNLMDSGTPMAKAWRVAMTDALRDQSQYVALPKRLADIIVDIWTLQFRMVKRQPASIFSLLNNRRFRAAYDFMLLRSQLNEVDADIAQWWTEIQEVDEAGKKEMIANLVDDEEDDEPNFNTFHHANSANGNGNQANNNNRRGTGRHMARRNKRRQPNNRSRNKNAKGQGQPQNKGNGGNANNAAKNTAKNERGTGKQNQARKSRRKTSKTSRSNPYRSRQKQTKEVPAI